MNRPTAQELQGIRLAHGSIHRVPNPKCNLCSLLAEVDALRGLLTVARDTVATQIAIDEVPHSGGPDEGFRRHELQDLCDELNRLLRCAKEPE